MTEREHRMTIVIRGLRTLLTLALLVTMWIDASTSVAAQGNGGMVIGASISCDSANDCGPEFSVQVSVTTEDGEFLGACTVTVNLLDHSHLPACSVDFPFRPSGTLIVTEDVSTLPAGYAPEENPIYVETTELGRASHDVAFQNMPQSGSVSVGQTSDVAIETMENGQSATDVCYILVDFSNEGCDENQDGAITFRDVPLGIYTLRQTADLGPGRQVEDTTIHITGSLKHGWESFIVFVDAPIGLGKQAVSGAQESGQDVPMFRGGPARTGLMPGPGPDPASGVAERWRFETGDAISSSPAVVDGVVYVAGEDSRLYALDATSGEERWRFATEDWNRSSPAVVAGVVYVGDMGGNLYAVDAASGAERWRFATDGPIESSPAVVNGVVYVGSGQVGNGDDDNLYAVDAASGAERWRFAAGGAISSSPAVVDGVVYVGSGAVSIVGSYGYLYALGARP